MKASVCGEVDRGAEPAGAGRGVDGEAAAPRAAAPIDASTPGSEVWIDPPDKPFPAPPSLEERSARDLAIEILRVARQEVLASANPCAIESPFIVARRAKRMLEDRLDAGAARDAVDAAIDRLVDRA